MTKDKQKDKIKEYKKRDCKKCGLVYCPEECFNVHPGSLIALRKLCNQEEVEKGIKVRIIK